MPVVPEPDSLTSAPVSGTWASLEWFERRNMLDADSGTGRIWWRPNGETPDDPIITAAPRALTPPWPVHHPFTFRLTARC